MIVHNAGVNRNNLLQDIKLEDYDFMVCDTNLGDAHAHASQMNVNVRGPILISQALLPHIPKHDGGRIIMLSSVSARQGPKFQTVYAASKIAVEQIINVWANEFGKRDGIKYTSFLFSLTMARLIGVCQLRGSQPWTCSDRHVGCQHRRNQGWH